MTKAAIAMAMNEEATSRNDHETDWWKNTISAVGTDKASDSPQHVGKINLLDFLFIYNVYKPLIVKVLKIQK